MQRTTRYILDWFRMTRARHGSFFSGCLANAAEEIWKRKWVKRENAFQPFRHSMGGCVCVYICCFIISPASCKFYLWYTFRRVSSTVPSSLAVATSMDNKAATTVCRVCLCTHQLRYSFCHLFRLMRIFMTKLLSLVAKRFFHRSRLPSSPSAQIEQLAIFIYSFRSSCLLPFMVKHTFASKMKSSQERASTLSIEYIFYVSIFAYFARSANSFASLSLSLALFPSLSYTVQTHTDRTQAASLCRSQLLYTILLRFF